MVLNSHRVAGSSSRRPKGHQKGTLENPSPGQMHLFATCLNAFPKINP